MPPTFCYKIFLFNYLFKQSNNSFKKVSGRKIYCLMLHFFQFNFLCEKQRRLFLKKLEKSMQFKSCIRFFKLIYNEQNNSHIKHNSQDVQYLIISVFIILNGYNILRISSTQTVDSRLLGILQLYFKPFFALHYIFTEYKT